MHGTCAICSEYPVEEGIDLNILSFERYKFGGVRHSKPIYIWFDLKQLQQCEVAEPTEQDVLILNNIIENVANLTSGRLSDAPECLKGIIKSNKYERSGIIEILGFFGILRVPDYPNYLKEYTPVHRRRHSSYSKSDWSFPADIWLPEYGVDVEAIQFWFGEYPR